jgi:hypothetical protein
MGVAAWALKKGLKISKKGSKKVTKRAEEGTKRVQKGCKKGGKRELSSGNCNFLSSCYFGLLRPGSTGSV